MTVIQSQTGVGSLALQEVAFCYHSIRLSVQSLMSGASVITENKVGMNFVGLCQMME